MTMNSKPFGAKGRLHRFRALRWSSAALLASLFFSWPRSLASASAEGPDWRVVR